jgi:hypothetical protein
MEKLQKIVSEVADVGGYVVERYITGRGRYEYAVLGRGGERFFIKAGFNQQKDYDEPVLLYNLQREVWWAQVIEALERRESLPFTSPHLVETNISFEDENNSDTGWIIFEYEGAQPISGGSIWDTGKVNKNWLPRQVSRFEELVPSLCATLDKLDNITSSVVSEVTVEPNPPYKPHSEVLVPDEFVQVIKRKKLLDVDLLERSLVAPKKTSALEVLGQGDFEVGHLLIRDDGKIVIVDNEFAGWYPKYDSLTYCVHRLWATRQQPELTKTLLAYYVDHYVTESDREQFWQDFSGLMVPRLVRGIYYDATRRTLPTGHKNQQLRRELLKILLNKNFRELVI